MKQHEITREDIQRLEYKLYNLLIDVLENNKDFHVRGSTLSVIVQYLKMKGNLSVETKSPSELYPGLEDSERNFETLDLPFI